MLAKIGPQRLLFLLLPGHGRAADSGCFAQLALSFPVLPEVQLVLTCQPIEYAGALGRVRATGNLNCALWRVPLSMVDRQSGR